MFVFWWWLSSAPRCEFEKCWRTLTDFLAPFSAFIMTSLNIWCLHAASSPSTPNNSRKKNEKGHEKLYATISIYVKCEPKSIISSQIGLMSHQGGRERSHLETTLVSSSPDGMRPGWHMYRHNISWTAFVTKWKIPSGVLRHYIKIFGLVTLRCKSNQDGAICLSPLKNWLKNDGSLN